VEESPDFLGSRLVPCESCRITATRFRYGPCAMCSPMRESEAPGFATIGDAVCDQCGRKIKRFVTILWNDKRMTVGVDCYETLFAKGAILWP